MAQKVHNSDLSGSVTINGVELTAVAAHLNLTAGLIAKATTTIALGSPGTTQTAEITIKDAAGDAIEEVRPIRVYLSDTATGSSVGTTAANGGVSATTGEIIVAHTAGIVFDAVTDANGVLVLSFNNSGGGGALTDRVVAVCDDGVVVSAALAVATS